MESTEKKEFVKDMTIGDALRMHESAGQVFASFHLGGCSHCSMSEDETLEQVTQGYGIDIELLLKTLNDLLTTE